MNLQIRKSPNYGIAESVNRDLSRITFLCSSGRIFRQGLTRWMRCVTSSKVCAASTARQIENASAIDCLGEGLQGVVEALIRPDRKPFRFFKKSAGYEGKCLAVSSVHLFKVILILFTKEERKQCTGV